MHGLRKRDIVSRLESTIRNSNSVIHDSNLASGNRLPWTADLEFPNRLRRKYRIYVWTVCHGGKSRSPNEYRIQTKLNDSHEFAFGNSATTVLLGYYHADLDAGGKAVGNRPTDGMEIVVSWDPLMHFNLGASSSCQVPFDLLERSRRAGVAAGERRLISGEVENIIAMRPEYLPQYLAAASGGHRFANVEAIETFRFTLV